MKIKPYSQFMDEKYGKKGTPERDEFEVFAKEFQDMVMAIEKKNNDLTEIIHLPPKT